MAVKTSERKIVIVNQAVNYLTIGLANAFNERFEKVALITGSIHTQGEELHPNIEISWINKWAERPQRKKMWSYLKGLMAIFWLLITRYRQYEIFFVSLPPMAYLLNIILPQKFSMLIWDVYPDIFKITGMSEKHPLYRIWAKLNKISFRKAYKLFTIGNKMAQFLEQYANKSKIYVTPIWSIFQKNERIPKEKNPFVLQHHLNGKFVVQYSGNIGLTHKVELMIDMSEKLIDHEEILFQIIGRGPRKNHLKKLVEEKQLSNCVFLPFQSDEMFPYSLSAADLGIVILDESTAKGSVPSKSYNLMSMGIPSLYIASEDSELQDYAKKFGHAACFTEKEIDKATQFIVHLAHNSSLKNQYAQNALLASQYFKRDNADKIVDLYLI